MRFIYRQSCSHTRRSCHLALTLVSTYYPLVSIFCPVPIVCLRFRLPATNNANIFDNTCIATDKL